MPVYSVEGKLGTGKTKFAVWRAQQALLDGRKVASNVDLFLDKLTPNRRVHYIRLPDKPTDFDLDAAGHGNPNSYDEDNNGIMILDELGTWLNSRNFQDKSRAGLLDWLIHARKKGWDVYLICQDANMIDKQIREALIEYSCTCLRGDKIKIPLIGWVFSTFNKKWGYLPRFHMVSARLGNGITKVVAERWVYKGDNLHAAYDTRQIFKSDYPHGAHSVYQHGLDRGTLFERICRVLDNIFYPPRPLPPPPSFHLHACTKITDRLVLAAVRARRQVVQNFDAALSFVSSSQTFKKYDFSSSYLDIKNALVVLDVRDRPDLASCSIFAKFVSGARAAGVRLHLICADTKPFASLLSHKEILSRAQS